MPAEMVREAHPDKNPHGDGRYIPALDGWRAVAILLVMLFHAIYNVISPEDSGTVSRSFRFISHLGALGVLIFFAISGYIITTRLYAEAQGGTMSLRIFYAKRCFRILPAMWLYLITLCVLALLHVLQLERADLFAPIFLSNYIPGSRYTSHFWSLSIEEHFYLLWPLCLLLAGWRRAIAAGVALMVAVGIYRGIRLEHLGVVDPNPGILGDARAYFLSRTEARIDYILAGCVLALLLIFYPSLTRVVRWCGSGTGVAVLLAMLLAVARVTTFDTRSLQAITIALLVVGVSLATKTVANRALSASPLVWLGKISYSLYLWQQLFLARSSIASLQTPLAVLPRMFGATLAAYLSYRCVERPVIRFGSSWIKRWRHDVES